MSNRFKNVAVGFGLVGMSLAVSLPASAQSKVAVIDLRRAVIETEEGLRVQAQLKRHLIANRQSSIPSKGLCRPKKRNWNATLRAASLPRKISPNEQRCFRRRWPIYKPC